MYNLKIILFAVLVSVSVFVEAQVECATIADIKNQEAGTSIKYTGTAQTTFYNGDWEGLFMEDATGGILLKGYNKASSSDKVKNNMLVTGLVGTWELGDSGKPSGLKITDKKSATVSANNFTPVRVSMADFIVNPKKYEGRAIVIVDAITTKKDGKYFLGELPFQTKNVSTLAPAAGEFAGSYIGLEYNRFLLCSAEHTKATEFFAFSDMAAYYKGKDIEVVDAKVQGSVLVNYVYKMDNNRTALFTQYTSISGMMNGLIVFVDGSVSVSVGDAISGFYGKYTDVYKNIMDASNFKGASFAQQSTEQLNIVSRGNKVVEKANVNISSLISHKLSAVDYHAQVVVSRYVGKLYSLNGKHYFKVSYMQSSSGDDTSGYEEKSDSIRVVTFSGIDLNKYVGDNVLLRAVYDANVINQEPTFILRDENDILRTYYTFNTIGEMLAAGELASSAITYELKGDVVVNFKRSQQQGVLNWAFVEDETGVLGINCSDTKFSGAKGDKVRGIKGTFEMSGKNLPNITLSSNAVIEKISSENELNVMRASLKEVIRDTMKYAGHIVEIYNVTGDSIQYENHDGSVFWSYFIEEDGYKMPYSFPKTAEEQKQGSNYQAREAIKGLNTIEAFVNYNCLDGGYVIYEIKRTPQDSLIVETENIKDFNANIYSSNGELHIESLGQHISVYTIDGLCVYSNRNTSNGVVIRGLKDIVFVKVDNEIYKIFVK